MAKRDPEYQITEEWRRSVRAALGTERGAQARLAKQVGCSPGTLTELLQGGKRSHLVPPISRALGVPMSTLILTPEALEIAAFVEQMGERGRSAMRRLRGLAPAELDLMLGLLESLAKTKRQQDE